MGHAKLDLAKLSAAERLELIGEIWASLESDALPVDSELAAELDPRLAEFEADPLEGRPAAEVIARIRATLK